MGIEKIGLGRDVVDRRMITYTTSNREAAASTPGPWPLTMPGLTHQRVYNTVILSTVYVTQIYVVLQKL